MSTPAAGLGLESIGQISIVVHDVPRAVAYYRDVLGMKFLFSAGPTLAFFDCGGVRLMLGPASEPRFDHPASIQAAFSTLKARGAIVEREPQLTANMGTHELWIGFLRDPDENVLALMSEVPLPMAKPESPHASARRINSGTSAGPPAHPPLPDSPPRCYLSRVRAAAHPGRRPSFSMNATRR